MALESEILAKHLKFESAVLGDRSGSEERQLRFHSSGKATIRTFSPYSVYVMALSVADYLLSFVYHSAPSLQRTVALPVVWIAVTALQFVDFVELVRVARLQKVQLLSAFFFVYSIVLVSSGVVVVDVVVRRIRKTLKFGDCLRCKVSASALFRGLVVSISRREFARRPARFSSRLAAQFRAVAQYAVAVLQTLFLFFSYFLFFIGLLMLSQEVSSTSIAYYMVVTLTTVGYGDISFKGAYGRFVTCVFIIVSIAYIPVEIGRVIGELKRKFPLIRFRYCSAGGVFAVGDPSEQLYEALRAAVPQKINLAFLATDSVENMRALKNSSSACVYQMERFDAAAAQKLQIQLAKQIVCYSTPRKADSDRVTLLNLLTAVSYTEGRVPAFAFFNSSSFEPLARQILMEHMPEARFVIVCMDKLLSDTIAVATLFDGWPVFLYNGVARQNLGFNEWPPGDAETLQGRVLQRLHDFVQEMRPEDEAQHRKTAYLREQFNEDAVFKFCMRKDVNVLTHEVRELGSLELCLAAVKPLTAQSFGLRVQSEELASEPAGESELRPLKTKRLGVLVLEDCDVDFVDLVLQRMRVLVDSIVVLSLQPRDGWAHVTSIGPAHLEPLQRADKVLIFGARPSCVDEVAGTLGRCLGPGARILLCSECAPQGGALPAAFRGGAALPAPWAFWVAQLAGIPAVARRALVLQEMIIQGALQLKLCAVQERVGFAALRRSVEARGRSVLLAIHDGAVLSRPEAVQLSEGDVLLIGWPAP